MIYIFTIAIINYHLSYFKYTQNESGKVVKCKVQNTKYVFFFFLDFGLSRLTSLQFIQYHLAGLYKPTIPQSPPSHLRDYSTCNNARLEFSIIFVLSFDPNEWCLKNGLRSGGLNPGPLGHESSALTTRPWLLAFKYVFNFCWRGIVIIFDAGQLIDVCESVIVGKKDETTHFI